MRLTILGGGGFRVPLVHRALLADRGESGITHLTLHDLDRGRLATIARVLAAQAEAVPGAPEVDLTTDLDEALGTADFVFLAIRVGGLQGRVLDERIALAEGVVGQETVGAGGICYGLRTIPVALQIARRIRAVAPDAWVLNFTNPAGAVTEAMSGLLGDRVIGICDSPAGLGRRAARALGVEASAVAPDYVGLNHLGWLRGLRLHGEDLLPRLLADEEALGSFEEGLLFGASWLRALGAIPNEYLHYYYYSRESLAAARSAERTRGEVLLQQQRGFYALGGAGTALSPEAALATWNRTRHERERTYMAENRRAAGAGERSGRDLDSGGYEGIALALLRAIARDERARLILNVRNRGSLPELDSGAVVEVPCAVDGNGARPLAGDPLPAYATGLVTSVKAVERYMIEAVLGGSRAAALRAFALHPLVDSVAVAQRLLTAYQHQLPALDFLH